MRTIGQPVLLPLLAIALVGALTGCNGGGGMDDKKMTDIYKNDRHPTPPSGDQMKKSLDQGHAALPPGAAGSPERAVPGGHGPPSGSAPPPAPPGQGGEK